MIARAGAPLLAGGTVQRSSTRTIAAFKNAAGESDLYEHSMSVTTSAGASVPIRLVYQDTQPADKTAIGTLVAVHGSPGSHRDFKYVAPLVSKYARVITVDLPGFGDSSYDHRLHDDNEERVRIVQSLIDALNLKENLIFMGHSRGGELALKLAAYNPESSAAVMLVNSIGLRPHRALKPFWLVWLVAALWKFVPLVSRLIEHLIFWLYNKNGIRVRDAKAAGRTLLPLRNIDFPRQRKIVERLNANNTRAFTLFGGADRLIEVAVSEELAATFRNNRSFVSSSAEGDDDAITQQLVGAIESGERHVSILFERDTHFGQKSRAALLAAVARALFAAAAVDAASKKKRQKI